MSIAVWFRESDEFPNGVVTYDDHAAEVKRLTAERDEARAVADHRAALEAEVERLRALVALAFNVLSDAVDSGYAPPKGSLDALAGEAQDAQ